MRVTIEFPPYNTRRYGRPWIAKIIDWPIGKSPVLEFGGLVGLTTEIDAKSGDVIRYGQRDNRGNNTQNDWGLVCDDGSVIDATPENARQHWLAGCPAIPAPETETKGGDNNVVPLRQAEG